MRSTWAGVARLPEKRTNVFSLGAVDDRRAPLVRTDAACRNADEAVQLRHLQRFRVFDRAAHAFLKLATALVEWVFRPTVTRLGDTLSIIKLYMDCYITASPTTGTGTDLWRVVGVVLVNVATAAQDESSVASSLRAVPLRFAAIMRDARFVMRSAASSARIPRS